MSVRGPSKGGAHFNWNGLNIAKAANALEWTPWNIVAQHLSCEKEHYWVKNHQSGLWTRYWRLHFTFILAKTKAVYTAERGRHKIYDLCVSGNGTCSPVVVLLNQKHLQKCCFVWFRLTYWCQKPKGGHPHRLKKSALKLLLHTSYNVFMPEDCDYIDVMCLIRM